MSRDGGPCPCWWWPFIALAIPIGVRHLLHSRLPLPWVLLPVALTVAARLLDHRFGRSRPWMGALSSLATFGFAAMLIGLVVITPYSAYRVWFDSVLLGSPRGAVSNVFVLATAFFSSLLSPALLTMGPAWTLLVLGLSVLYLLGMILPSPLVFLVILAGAAGSLALLAARTRGIGSGRASFTILLFLLSVGLAFLLAGDRRPQGSRLIDRVVYPGLRDLAVSVFPGFPLVYEIPGYGYSFNEKRLGGRPALSDNPIFTVEGRPGETLYLRTRIFDLYDGRSWKAALPEFEFPRLRAAWRVFSSRFSGEHNLRLTLEADFYNSLPHTLDTYHVNLAGGAGEGPGRGPSAGPRLIPQGDLETGYRLEPPLQHGDTILVAHGEVPPGAFPRRSPWNAPPADPLELSVSQRAAYLQLPEELPVELRRLAWRLAGGRTEPQEVLRSIQRFLESNYIYNLNPREPRQARDFVAGFLFGGDSSGYCVHFASSLIVLARLNGIPARYATGFLAIIPSTTNRATVTGMAAHAWPEVWLEGRGWVTWEATTAVDPTAWQRTAGELIYNYHLASDPLTARQIASLMGAPEGTALMGEGGAPPRPPPRRGPPRRSRRRGRPSCRPPPSCCWQRASCCAARCSPCGRPGGRRSPGGWSGRCTACAGAACPTRGPAAGWPGSASWSAAPPPWPTGCRPCGPRCWRAPTGRPRPAARRGQERRPAPLPRSWGGSRRSPASCPGRSGRAPDRAAAVAAARDRVYNPPSMSPPWAAGRSFCRLRAPATAPHPRPRGASSGRSMEPIRKRKGRAFSTRRGGSDPRERRRLALASRRRGGLSLQEQNRTLEQRVVERTEEVMRRTDQLRALAAELTEAEQRSRRELAGVLHDELQQLLVGARLYTSMTQLTLQHHKARPALDQATLLIDQAIRITRGLTLQLNPPALDQESLSSTLHWLAQWMEETHRLKVRVEAAEGIEGVEESIRVFLFHALRELLFNVVKHSGTREATAGGGAGGGGAAAGTWSPTAARASTRTRGGTRERKGSGCSASRSGCACSAARWRWRARPGPVPGSPCSCRRAAGGLPGRERRPRGCSGGAPDPPRGRARPTRRRRTRVLVVDDHAMLREGMAVLLRPLPDIEVVGEAASGEEAVERARRLRPDVVLMDVSMPGMNGIEATRRILAESPGTRVIGLTMFEDAQIEASMRKAGAVAYFTKGNQNDSLVGTIRSRR